MAIASINSSDAALSDNERATLHTAMHTLGEHLQEINQLLDDSFSSISNQFIEISGMVQALASITGETERQAQQTAISALIGKTIMDMQFQDRVSQNLVITMNILRESAAKLNTTNAAALDDALGQDMVRLLNLGEIKQKFITYAQSRGWLSNPDTFGVVAPAAAGDDDIELF